MKPKFILALALACVCSLAYAQKDTLRILAIGNSFSNDAVANNFSEIAHADGRYFVIVANINRGGCSLERHWNNYVKSERDYSYMKYKGVKDRSNKSKALLIEALRDEPWDVVTIQQVSHQSGIPSSYEPYLGDLLKVIRENVPAKARLMWQQTWAYSLGSLHGGFANYGNDQITMYSKIVETSTAFAEKYGLEIIPSGTAVQNVRTSFDGDNITRDGYHMNHGIGRMTVALTWYEAITGRCVVGNTYKNPFITDDRLKVAQMAADFACKSPYKVTSMADCFPQFKNSAANYDESKVGDVALPDALTLKNGKKVKNSKEWMTLRRPELLEMFENEIYGKAPGRPEGMTFTVLSTDKNALGGKATRKEVKIQLTKDKVNYIRLLVYTPNKVQGKAPLFLGVNFKGNFAITDDPSVTMDLDQSKYGRVENKERGAAISRWPLESIIDAGYGVATFYRGDVAPDFDSTWERGTHKFFFEKGQKMPKPDQWGAIAAWSWGLSRSLDYLETDPDVDAKKVAVFGHSRLGKAALWAGAKDERFAMVISNDSGCMGAAPSRRCFGETPTRIFHHFPYWFCGNFQKYIDNVDALPVDQHELVALIAPRPVYVASADKDLWADPKGEGISAEKAKEVYRLWGKKAAGKVGRHIREGKHDITAFDWDHYIKFADKFLK